MALPWITCLAYIRVFTNPRAVRYPLPLSEVTATIDQWFDRPVVRKIGLSRRFWGLFQKLLVETQAMANISSDAYLAALAIENDCLESIRSQSKNQPHAHVGCARKTTISPAFPVCGGEIP